MQIFGCIGHGRPLYAQTESKLVMLCDELASIWWLLEEIWVSLLRICNKVCVQEQMNWYTRMTGTNSRVFLLQSSLPEPKGGTAYIACPDCNSCCQSTITNRLSEWANLSSVTFPLP